MVARNKGDVVVNEYREIRKTGNCTGLICVFFVVVQALINCLELCIIRGGTRFRKVTHVRFLFVIPVCLVKRLNLYYSSSIRRLPVGNIPLNIYATHQVIRVWVTHPYSVDLYINLSCTLYYIITVTRLGAQPASICYLEKIQIPCVTIAFIVECLSLYLIFGKIF